MMSGIETNGAKRPVKGELDYYRPWGCACFVMPFIEALGS